MKMRFHLLFEQSGTFKNVLKEYGYEAFDYDLLNDFNETDYVIDIFKEIENEYENIVQGGAKQTMFTNLDKDNDFIIAFFPCTHFSGLNQFQYKLLIAGKKRELNKDAIKRLIDRNQERAKFFEIYLKFCFIVSEKKIKTIIENPASCSGNYSYLELFSPIDIGYKELNRQKWGDLYRKPTNYFAINFGMIEKFLMFTPVYSKKTILDNTFGMKERSMISKVYAENFYKRFLEGRFENIGGEK